MNRGRIFAVIPAAGLSRRMGRPKLTLPLGSATVIESVLTAVQIPELSDCVVVARRDDTPLHERVDAAGARLVTGANDPPDMRASVQIALDSITSEHRPDDHDCWMLVPGDCVGLQRPVVEDLAAAWLAAEDVDILTPRLGSRRGHPTFFRWGLVRRLNALPGNVGVNALLNDESVRIVGHAVQDPGVLGDLDTPDDYTRVRRS